MQKEQVKEKGKYTGEVQEVTVDYGVEDKRLFATESEFTRSLKVMEREHNILTEIMCDAYDHGNISVLVKNPYGATDAHICVIGHISQEGLKKYLQESAFFSGFANRWLWLCVKRGKLQPRGDSIALKTLDPQITELKEAILWASEMGEIKRDQEADELWGNVYPELAVTPSEIHASRI